MKLCKHDLIGLTRAVYMKGMYSPAIFKCTKCLKLFQLKIGTINDSITEIELCEGK